MGTGVRPPRDAKEPAKIEGDDAVGSILFVPAVEDGTTMRGIRPRHSYMISLTSGIGSGLFVGTGATLALGGPLFLLLGFATIAFLTYLMITAVVEIATFMPINSPSISSYAIRIVSPSLGYALGWLYVYSFGILVPYEITTAALVIDFWSPGVNPAVWSTIFLLLIIAINLFSVEVYGESEFWFALLRILAMIGLLLFAVVIFFGGGPHQHGVLGFHYWKDPGVTPTFLKDGPTGVFLAFLTSLIFSIFPFLFGPELLIFTSGEIKDPQKNLPKGAKVFILRLVTFYILAVLAMGIICPYNEPQLSSGATDANASPFVIGIRLQGISSLPSVFNAAILASTWSTGDAFLYLSSRALYAMAVKGQAPKIFAKCNRHGTPYSAVLACASLGLLAYLNVGTSSSVVFRWLVNLTNTSGFVSWVCCCIIHLRFRQAWKALGRPPMGYKSRLQPYGSWFCGIAFTTFCLINGFYVFFPGEFTTSSFLTAYIGLPIFFAIYLGHKFWKGRSDPWFLSIDHINLQEILDTYQPEVIPEAEEPERPTVWKRWRGKSA
ncbi:amino acid permease/ SLC12A domain-containing protein [Penicillium herquei]|nr:amino acid permease/ SLC12A domain-containing protein [Penicillium herquei]